ncbi:MULTISPECIES: TetR/AcrR family transcriptional regulator [unclassified Ornithinimicrobium]|uniref:TetR/AcrR family transcriptional regulator n=1 Tax=unclassified Ornithinimicrobium TaxID=2615080 RepID=UPI0038537264
MTGVRERARAETTARILAAARRQIEEHGGGGLSMRAVARDVGLVSSAVYRYFPTREALLTAMIVESYSHLDAALGAAPHRRAPARRWAALAAALRSWALDHRQEFQLIYGTPIPGYVAPPETVPAAAAVAQHFLAVGAREPVPAFDRSPLVRQLAPVAASLTADLSGPPRELEPSGVAAVIAELAALVGLVSLELAGHLVGSADPADHLFAAVVERQVQTLGLT